jgi:hypothetical protein
MFHTQRSRFTIIFFSHYNEPSSFSIFLFLFVKEYIEMPSWIDTFKSGHALGTFRDPNSKYVKCQDTAQVKNWKNVLDDAGSGLRGGISFKKEKDVRVDTAGLEVCVLSRDKYLFQSNLGNDGYNHQGSSVDTLTRLRVNGGPVSIVHGIPCVDLPVSVSESSYSEPSRWERAKWSRYLREKKKFNISSPQLLPDNEDNVNLIPPPIEKDERYARSIAPRSVRLEVNSSTGQYTIKDVSSSFKMSTRKATINSFNAEPSSASPRGKPKYPGVTKIPEDLPCHRRYIPLARSRSTRVLESQNAQSRLANRTMDTNETECEEVWSDTSSIYSQESMEVQIKYDH